MSSRSSPALSGTETAADGGGPIVWWFDNEPVVPEQSLTIGPSTIDLTFIAEDRSGIGYGVTTYGETYGDRVDDESSPDDLAFFRQYERAGDLNVSTGFQGQFHVVDRSGRNGAATVSVAPAGRHAPPVAGGTFYVAGYSERQLSVDLFEVSLTLQRDANRSAEFTPTGDSLGGWGDEGWGELGWSGWDIGGDHWTFGFDHGAFELDAEDVSVIDTESDPAGGERSLSLLVSPDEAAVIADSAGYPAAAMTRTVPDGRDKAVDEADGRQTMYLAVPADLGDVGLTEGAYVVMDWELELLVVEASDDTGAQDVWQANLDIMEKHETNG